ncbi:MAG: SGNH/GDSL hydrolase family protein [Gemmataceae bacterium]|nr:SGNH/GDSL hydrolase family protein [Gemmataceae bacterium]
MPPVRLAAEPLEAREVPAAAFDSLPILPTGDPAALDHARAIAARGRLLGRRADVFIKVGDSNTDYGPFGSNGYLKPLGAAGFNPITSGLTSYGPGLIDTWATFRAPVDGLFNSWNRPSTTAYPGYSLPNILPALPGEIAATNGGVALVAIGTNDITVYGDAGRFRDLLRSAVRTLAGAGVVPVLSTIPDNRYGGGTLAAPTRVFNQVIADVADAENLPLWNLFAQTAGLPNAGLEAGGVHLTHADGNDGLVGASLLYGQNTHNLGALQVLDWYRREVAGAGPEAVAVSDSWTSLAGRTVYAAGRDIGQSPVVGVYDADTGREVNRFLTFEPTFAGGVRVAVADVTGDGISDIVAGAGPGGGPAVRVFSGADGSVVASFFAFEGSFRGGVGSVAAADLDGDGTAEVVVGAGDGGGPVVAVYHGGDFAEVGRFAAYEETFRGGVNVAAGVFAGVGPAVVTGAGRGGGPVVRLFPFGSDTPAASFFAFDPADVGGLAVAAGDLDGDGFAEVAAAPAVGVPRVQVFDAVGQPRASYFAGPEDGGAGVRLAIRGGRLLVGSGVGAAVSVRAYPGLSAETEYLPPDEPGRAYGIFVG